MTRRAKLRRRATAHTARIQERFRLKEHSTVLALVSTRLSITAMGTGTAQIAISKKPCTVQTVRLRTFMFTDKTPRIQMTKQRLRKLSMRIACSAPKIIEGQIKPLIDVAMQCMVVRTQLCRTETLFCRTGFACRAVFVGTTYKTRVIAAHPTETCENVCRKTLDKISQMWNVVHIGECGGD